MYQTGIFLGMLHTTHIAFTFTFRVKGTLSIESNSNVLHMFHAYINPFQQDIENLFLV